MSCAAHELAVSRRFLEWEDVDLIRHLVSMIPEPAARVVDLGAGSGTTALSVFAERPTGVHVWTVDHHEEALMWSGKAVANIGRSADWTPILGKSVNIPPLEDGGFDLLLLDTSHEYEDTIQELEIWLPRLRGEKLVWCHDYRGYPGVTQAVDELVGLGVLKQIDVRGLGWAGRLV